ncbi:protein kinase domain-containing protein [Rhodopirellula sp. JC639]|uniref:protein kinase domain-containing protein n=1 Tax=Stieleria mannarensis TaxID=2755585 RepID=UPI0015FF9069|nr:protein kinase [Rhodopirellula sp. JC639]
MKPDTEHQEKLQNVESMTDRPDGWLLRRWKNGDENAAEVLFDRYAIRLVALVASRLNRRYRSQIDPDEVVQSAMGSFFDAARHSRIRVSQSVSLWRLLATFARRKLARSIERQGAAKRGGEMARISLSQVSDPPRSASSRFLPPEVSNDDADEFINHLKSQLPPEQFAVVEGLLAGQTQREIAESLSIDERTVRRRVAKIRQSLAVHRNSMSKLTTQPDSRRVLRTRRIAKAKPCPAPTSERTATVQPAPNRGHTRRLASSTTELPRITYNRFVLGKLIGSGGFGKVYRASLQSDGTTVAVKFLRRAYWQNEAARQSFLREINAASRIHHPGVLRYLGYGESPHGGPYVLSEWIDGRPLHALDRPSERCFTQWLRQICDAIAAVHAAGLVHGDLTPANILIDDHDRITITDFGFSQATLDASSPPLGGTLGFAAPEQIDPAFGDISPKTDTYAIGGLIHWYLFGTPPNAGDGAAETLLKTIEDQRSQDPTDPQTEAPLQAILRSSLAPSPADRTATVEDILERLTTDHATTAPPAKSRTDPG